MGRKGHGQPCYCWQEVAPFFPDGETEAQGLGTCPRSLTVSQLAGWGWGWGAHPLGNSVTCPLGRNKDRWEGGCPEGHTQPEKPNDARPTPPGHQAGENSGSGKTGITSRLRLKKGSTLFSSQAWQGPPIPGALSPSPYPTEDLAGVAQESTR